MRWFNYEKTGPQPKVTKINVRQLGIPQVVVVRTRKNGGIRVKTIPVKEAVC